MALEAALSKLERYYGNDSSVTEAHIAHITRPEPIRWSVEAFQTLVNELEDIQSLFKIDDRIGILNSPGILKGVITRLPKRTKEKLTERLSASNVHMPSFEYLLAFVNEQLDLVSHPLSQLDACNKQSSKVESSQRVNRESKFRNKCDKYNVKAYSQNVSVSSCPVVGCLNKESHALCKCGKFAELNKRDRWAITKRIRRCYKCLEVGHMAAKCKSHASCQICHSKAHHSLLCDNLNDDGTKTLEKRESRNHLQENNEGKAIDSVKCHNVLISKDRKLLPVLPVQVRLTGGDKRVIANCLLDTGSDTTLASRRLANMLGVQIKNDNTAHVMIATSNARTKETCFNIDLEIKGLHTDTLYRLANVVCVTHVGRHNNPIGRIEIDINKNPHLREVVLDPLENSEIDLIIGTDYEALLDMQQVKRSTKSCVTAKRSSLGWVLVGTTESIHQEDVAANEDNTTCAKIHSNNLRLMRGNDIELGESAYVCNGNINSCELLHAEIDRYFYAEFDVETDDDDVMPSKNDLTCNRMYDDSVVKIDGRFSVDLPLRTDKDLPSDNKVLAESRLLKQRNLLQRDAEARQFYVDAIDRLIKTDKIEPVDDSNDDTDRVYYIPHFVTCHKKRRLVYDASVKGKGSSLNSFLLQGVDTTQRLWHVLMRFRRFPVAFTCDIKEMFLQCGINEKDRNLLRILWFKDHDLNGPIVTFRFKRLPYGLNCSMSMANYCLKKTVDENVVGASTQTLNAAADSFYVDDGLVSCPNVESAGTVAQELTQLLQSGGFELRKFVSNAPEVLRYIDSSRVANGDVCKEVTDSKVSECKVLGLHWDPVADVLSPRVNIKERPCTKRGVWATIAQVFDPLGICAPYLLTGRRIMQEVAEEVREWDDPLPADIAKRWRKWLNGLPNLQNLSLRRSLWKSKPESYQLHTFCDSSEKGYGCVTYMRMRQNGQYHVSFVMGKAKVVPKQSNISIPKLELIAALLGARMHNQIKRAIKIPLNECVLYTDSSVVLNWIETMDKRLTKYVSRKINDIKRLCGGDEWRHVSSSCNPADVCSRGLNPKDASNDNMYFNGPLFLRENTSDTADHITSASITVEIERVKGECASVPEYLCDVPDRYSEYEKCLRIIAYRYRYILYKVKKRGFLSHVKCEIGCLKQHERRLAEIELVRIGQEKYFGQRVMKVVSNHNFEYALQHCYRSERSKLSEIKNLLPYFDQSTRVLRVGGRIVNAALPDETIHQYIIPKSGRVTELLVKYYHEMSCHFGANYVLSQIVRTFWLSGGISTIRKYTAECQYCKIRRAKSMGQIMGNLPKCRVNVPKHPFEHTGVDLFGPIAVQMGRSVVKRWGVLFICMASRACHIEVVPDLTTDAFLQCFWRFTSRRGLCCRYLYSDQGTNFKGCDSELKELLKSKQIKGCRTPTPKIPEEVDRSRIATCLSRKGVDVQWRFNVPKNLHAGGSWERAIRSLKAVFAAIIHNGLLAVPALKKRNPTEYELLTILCEVEAVMNCRPITKLTSELEDWRALTPMTILTGNLHPDIPSHDFSKGDQYRQNYKYVIAVAEQFWERWLKMYIPWLQIRHCWKEAMPNLKKGDLILLKDSESEGRREFPKAVIEEVYPDENGYVRTARVVLSDGRVFNRDVRTMVHLEGFAAKEENNSSHKK